MSSTIQIDKKTWLLAFTAAGTTVIAGILHLQLVPMSISHDIGEGILFLVGGVLQIFWAVPVIKQWGRIWQIIGIVGTIVFTILWFSTHTHSLLGSAPSGHMPAGAPPGNMSQGPPQGNITGGHFPRGPPPRGIASIPQIEFFQIAFIVLYTILSKRISTRQKDTLEN
ncbi:MAG: hypothetical protein KGH89_08715 [Thaumarchaeota archaeon]|nr:hypothetical protein [Nitrososphaerota archaeon]